MILGHRQRPPLGRFGVAAQTRVAGDARIDDRPGGRRGVDVGVEKEGDVRPVKVDAVATADLVDVARAGEIAVGAVDREGGLLITAPALA